MRYKVILEVVVEENHVEDALQETMMIARSLCEHEDVWPKARYEDWLFETPNWNGPNLGCKVSVTKVEG
jgi:hypothetical protein